MGETLEKKQKKNRDFFSWKKQFSYNRVLLVVWLPMERVTIQYRQDNIRGLRKDRGPRSQMWAQNCWMDPRTRMSLTPHIRLRLSANVLFNWFWPWNRSLGSPWMTNTIHITVTYCPSAFCDLFLLNFENTSCHSSFFFYFIDWKNVHALVGSWVFLSPVFLKCKVRSCTDLPGLIMPSRLLPLLKLYRKANSRGCFIKHTMDEQISWTFSLPLTSGRIHTDCKHGKLSIAYNKPSLIT